MIANFKRRTITIIGILALLPLSAQNRMEGQKEQDTCPVIKIESERLPDMNIPRSGHTIFCIGDEVVVAGGHTSGFIPTPTAEYLKDGKWHLMDMVYAHDGGFAVQLHTGQILLAGGYEKHLGIGQTHVVEMYAPATHRFTGFGCLDQKRASATGIELSNGQVLITGNWYADDGMEIFDGKAAFSHLKAIKQSRCLPHLFRTSNDDILVVAGYDNKGQPIDTIIVERMRGEAFRAPLLDDWHPLQYDLPLYSDNSFIGDEKKGIFAYLMPVKNRNGQVAIAEVRDTVFSLLPTDHPVPMKTQWGKILYYTPVYTDRQHQRGYVMGCDSTGRQYTLCLDYAKTPARLKLYHTNPLTDSLTLSIPVLTDDGNLILTGIKPATMPNFNFYPLAQVWLLRFHDDSLSANTGTGTSVWFWIVIILVIVIITTISIVMKRKEKTALPKTSPETSEESLSAQTAKGEELLMKRILHLIEDEKAFLNCELTTSEIARELGSHRNQISSCINSQTGRSFSQLVNGYRIEYAKQLMEQRPGIKLSSVGIESGFANETSFFRAFKAITGMTPTEWKSKKQPC